MRTPLRLSGVLAGGSLATNGRALPTRHAMYLLWASLVSADTPSPTWARMDLNVAIFDAPFERERTRACPSTALVNGSFASKVVPSERGGTRSRRCFCGFCRRLTDACDRLGNHR